MKAMDLYIKMMAKHKYRSWYMKIYASISKHGCGYIIMDHLNETNYCLFLSEFGQRCEDIVLYRTGMPP